MYPHQPGMSAPNQQQYAAPSSQPLPQYGVQPGQQASQQPFYGQPQMQQYQAGAAYPQQPMQAGLNAPGYQPGMQAPGYAGGASGMPPASHGYAVVDAKYCLPQETVFMLKEAKLSMSGDDFSVFDAAGKKCYRMDSAALSVTGRRVLYDEHSKSVFSMKRKLMSSHKTWTIHRGSKADDAQRLCQIKMNKVPGPAKTAVSVAVYLAGNASSNFSAPTPDYTVTGDTRTKGFWVYKGQQPAAEIVRKLAVESATLRLLGKDQYALRVLPGFDHVFMLGLAVAVDELFFD